jgi:arsenite/tail-anchored protein-transporting ATPase
VLMQVDEAATDGFLKMRRKDQQRALKMLRDDEQLQSLRVVEAPLLDLEVRGVPALKYFGSKVWEQLDD